MKKLARELLLLFISIQLVAREGSLEPHLYGVVDTGSAFNIPVDLSAATVVLYYKLRQRGWGPYLFCDGSSFVVDEVSTEEWTAKWSWVAFLNGSQADADRMVKGFYNWTTPSITRYTYTITKTEESPVAQPVKDLYIVEIRALRAFFVLDLYRLYGPIPMILEVNRAVNPDSDYKPYESTSEEVGAFLTTRPCAAADVLPVEQAEHGRITKGAVLHCLLKYYMHEKRWQNTFETASEITGLSCYELEEDYASTFSAQSEGDRELMFAVRAEPLADYGNHTYANTSPGDYASPYGNIVEGWSGRRMSWEFHDAFDGSNRQRALAQVGYTSKSGATVDLRVGGDVGALPSKYRIDPKAAGTWAGNDEVLNRYTKVLLFKAEVLSELNGPNRGNVDLVDDIRKRAFGSGISLPAVPISKESFDREFVDSVIGMFSMNNYDQAGESTWKYDVDRNNTLSNGNSLYVEVESSGTEFQTLQMRIGPLVAEGRKYSVKVKLKASKDIQSEVRVEGPLSYMEFISLKAGEVKEFSIQIDRATEDQNYALFLALGNLGSGYELQIDEVESITMEQTADGGDAIIEQLSDFSDKESLGDWTLKGRGWEFWYGGKCRKDLIRMERYVETGKKHNTNFSEKNLLFLIPTSVIIENSHIEQNPYY